jgi:predicted SnoaL-like aldol condensation-catalyzing enzyme
MIEIVDPDDTRAVRSKDSLIAFYASIGEKRPVEAAADLVHPDYIQHNPLIADGGEALGQFFAQIAADRANARVIVHRIIAVGDWVWAHVNFVNLFNDDPDDPGIAGVDIWKMDADGKAVEHWDTLQLVGAPDNSAPWLGPSIPRANQQGMF